MTTVIQQEGCVKALFLRPFLSLFRLPKTAGPWYDLDAFMQIYWHGYSSVRIESKNGEKASVLVTDPFENESAIRFPRTVDPDVIVLGHQDRKRFALEGVGTKPFVISDPGEYEVKGVFVNGIQDQKKGEGLERPLIYRIFTEGMAIAFIGPLKRKPTDAELERLENIDILLVPVGGGDAYDPEMASDVISIIEPRVVVPLNFAIPGIKTQLGSVEQFCKHLGVCKREDMSKLKIQKKDLPPEDVLVAVLERG
jgi:L-ascorbate metabolism protein UlaG (beta-lactamase superfamily)